MLKSLRGCAIMMNTMEHSCKRTQSEGKEVLTIMLATLIIAPLHWILILVIRPLFGLFGLGF